MSEQPVEPYDIAIARRQKAEREAQIKAIEAQMPLRFMYAAEVAEIDEFLAAWEAGQISE